MVSFFSKEISARRNIILEIQSDLVRGALVENSGDDIPKTLAISSKTIPSSLVPNDSKRTAKKIVQLVHDVVTHLAKESGHHSVNHIDYILSSPWVFSELKTVKAVYETEKKITRELIDEIINKEIDSIPAQFDAYIFERKVYEVKLNGYAVNYYEGKTAHSLEISFSSSFGSKTFMDDIKYAIDSVIHIKKHSCHSALLMQYIGIGATLAKKREYVYIHVHGELTDMVIVKDNLCKHLSSFPLGIKTLLRKLAHTTHHDTGSADSLLTLYQGNKLSESEKKKTQSIIEPLLKEWDTLCTKAFLSSFDTIHMPKTVILSAHSHFDLFRNILASRSDMNFEVLSYGDLADMKENSGMNMYTQALSIMV